MRVAVHDDRRTAREPLRGAHFADALAEGFLDEIRERPRLVSTLPGCLLVEFDVGLFRRDDLLLVELAQVLHHKFIASTDGGGRSLVRVLSSTSPNASTYLWRESTQNNGNPGGTDAIAFTGSPLADADGDSIPALLE